MIFEAAVGCFIADGSVADVLLVGSLVPGAGGTAVDVVDAGEVVLVVVVALVVLGGVQTEPPVRAYIVHNHSFIMQAEVKEHSETLEEEVCDTIGRDFKNVLVKLRYVIVPKFNMESDPEGVRELRNWDLWGPLLLCLSLSLILNIGMDSKENNQFGVVFLLMWGGAAVVTVNTKLLGGHISFFQCVCVLGYCIFPIVLGALAVLILTEIGIKVLLLKLAIAVLVLVWSTMASITYMNVIIDDDKNVIAIYPIFLFYLFIAWFVIFI